MSGWAASAIPATRGELATLWVDGPGAAFNIGLVCRFDAGPFRRANGSVDGEAVRTVLARRALAVPALRRRLVVSGRPAWVDGPLDPEQHIRCADLPDGVDLVEWCADRIIEPLDRARPLWRADVVGLAGGEFVLLLVAHHVLVDGRRGVAVLRSLLDGHREGDPSSTAAEADRRPSTPPGRPHRWRQIRHAIGDLRGRAPVTSLSLRVGPERRVAVLFADLAGLGGVEDAFGATVNDVLLAAVTAGLRQLLLSRGEAVAELEMRASVPVSSGAAGQPEGMLLLSLPVYEDDPLRRLETVARRTAPSRGDCAPGVAPSSTSSACRRRWPGPPCDGCSTSRREGSISSSPTCRGRGNRCRWAVPGCSARCPWRRSPRTCRSAWPPCPTRGRSTCP